MKLVERLDEFLTNAVNLNQGRINTLEQRVETIANFIRASEYAPKIVRFSAQGSWAHKTIIKPPTDRQEFDADLVVYLNPVDGWGPSDYIGELRRIFWDSAVYADKTSYKSRCVMINYAGDFHLDVVPIIVERNASDVVTYSVCNRADNRFEHTDGDGFRDWWLGQNNIVGGNRLIKTARLIKYLRDYKIGQFSAKSVVLTTLIGNQITEVDREDEINFSDLPSTLKTVVDRLDNWLQDRPLLPAVENPALPGESFTRNWTEEEYGNFRTRIRKYREGIDDAFEEPDRDASIAKWRDIFGDEYAKGETLERASAVVTKLAETIDRGRDIVDQVIVYGREILKHIPAKLAHVRLPGFPRQAALLPVRIVAKERRAKGGAVVRDFRDGDTIDRNSGVEFQALQVNGLPFPENFEVRWQVVNTGQAAAEANALRGEFKGSDTHGYLYETTLYRGAHWVQAFVLNRRNGMLSARSERFFVVIT
ncbi:cyclic GMP-AMP synthase DncV-like nucleotidyltransferase [Mesorhizobium sp.]|uniref:SMODS domain-containing nucleotidyltransferase n=1 Tax=Mesorhizobium sp. TaxID=1871066 RepID=UPI000FD1913D|nr:nucleotidyltransferase [Mesorhizobium sp.]RVC63979.1 nucleotidyltransferase [Mesorhizobium sp. M4B.F.Ca.ET.088.02.2.1]RWF32434.1 MAG: nucleotidyltransferase [Mesorhizobium sp.]